MGQGRRARSISAQLLLLALAIQGITPDAQDIASLNALRLFCPHLADPNTSPDDDESPDDVCGSVQLDTHLAIRKRVDSRGLPFFGSVRACHRTPMVYSSALRPAIPGGPEGRIGDLIHALCRLTC